MSRTIRSSVPYIEGRRVRVCKGANGAKLEVEEVKEADMVEEAKEFVIVRRMVVGKEQVSRGGMMGALSQPPGHLSNTRNSSTSKLYFLTLLSNLR